jgi:hypothetical protein
VTVNSVVDDAGAGTAHARVDDPASLLRAVLAFRARQDAVAAHSYWHPNGYLKVVVAGGTGTRQLRLHAWASTETDDDVHDHAWSYASVVLAGMVHEVVYGETEPGAGTRLWRQRYEPAGPGRFVLGGPDEVSLAVVSQHDRGPGERSGGDAARIHRFFAAEAPAVTLLSVEPAIRRYSHVYRRSPAPDRAIAPGPTSRPEVSAWVEFALARLCPA